MNMLFRDREFPDPVRYSPSRDMAYCYGTLLQRAESFTAFERWDELSEFIKDSPVPADELAAAWAAVAKIMSLATDKPKETFQQHLEESGWNALPTRAKFAICTAIGRVSFAAFWKSITETVTVSENAMTKEELADAAATLAEKLAVKPWWFRAAEAIGFVKVGSRG